MHVGVDHIYKRWVGWAKRRKGKEKTQRKRKAGCSKANPSTDYRDRSKRSRKEKKVIWKVWKQKRRKNPNDRRKTFLSSAYKNPRMFLGEITNNKTFSINANFTNRTHPISNKPKFNN